MDIPEVAIQQTVTVEALATARDLGLQLEVIHGDDTLRNRITSPRIQKLGLALAGFPDYIHPGRVQVFGGSEANYLRILEPAAYEQALRGLEPLRICCLIITRGLEVPPGLLDLVSKSGFALLRAAAPSSVAIRRITDYLESKLAVRTTVHGVLLAVFGLGVLILGPSGIGKSECALELILRGHRLVADDSVEISRYRVDRLVGTGGPVLRHHMELRGLGIIDIKQLFGVSATSQSHELDFVVRLERWKPQGQYDRLGIDRKTVKILDVPMPLIEMPVAPGRNVSTLVEVAARNHLLRGDGYQAPKELSADLPPDSGGRPGA